MRRQGGFTLIELMLVILIMGMVTTWIVASLPSAPKVAPAQRLALAASHALRQANTLQVPFRLSFTPNSWCVSSLTPGKAENSERLKARWQQEKTHCETLPADLRLIPESNLTWSTAPHVYFLPGNPGIRLPVQIAGKNQPAFRVAISDGRYIAEQAR